jgi:hypothetical protein
MSTFRTDIVAGFTTMMTAFIAAHPTLLTRHFRFNPESPKDIPYSYMDIRPEVAGFAVGVETRTLTASLIIVGRPTEGGQMADTFDTTVDALVTFIGGYGGAFGGHITNDSVWSTMNITDAIEVIGESRFPAVRLSFPDLSHSEGRS